MPTRTAGRGPAFRQGLVIPVNSPSADEPGQAYLRRLRKGNGSGRGSTG
jgi:hypothetical protein